MFLVHQVHAVREEARCEVKSSMFHKPATDEQIEYGDVVIVTRGTHRGIVAIYDNDGDSEGYIVLYAAPDIVMGLGLDITVRRTSVKKPTIHELLERRERLLKVYTDESFRAGKHAFGIPEALPKQSRSQVAVPALLELLLVEQAIFSEIHRSALLARRLPPDDTFISYATEDSWFTKQLFIELSKRGTKPWMYEYAIAPGDNIPVSISNGIGAAKFGFVVLTPRAIASQWVRQEWSALLTKALAGGLRLVPLLVESCEVPALLAPIRYIDCRSGLTNDVLDDLNRSFDVTAAV